MKENFDVDIQRKYEKEFCYCWIEMRDWDLDRGVTMGRR